MPNVTYMNRSAPFWDFVAGLEQEGANHPFFSQFNRNSDGNTAAEAGPSNAGPEGLPFGAWGWGFPFGGDRGIPHHRGPPPPAGRQVPRHQREEREERDEGKDFEKDFERELNREFDEDSDEKSELKNEGKEKDNGEGPSGTGTGSDAEGCCHRRGGRRGEWGPRRGRHGCGPRGWGGPGPHGPHGHAHERGPGHGHGRRGGWGGWRGRGGPFGGNHPFNPLAFASSLFEADTAKPAESDDFSPDADIFDTPEAFVVHVSLPGAKKEDVGVNWDVEKSELQIAGVIYRPGDEKLLEQLAMTERKVGAFERKIRLGTRANPANVDADQISAKMEDGVLRVNVPKMGENGFVEIRKVDIE